MPYFGIIWCLLEERIPSNDRKIFFWQRLWEHALNYSQYIVSYTNKHFKFDLDKKLNLWLKFEPNFLTWLVDDK